MLFKKLSSADRLMTEENRKKLVESIGNAEKNTSGEIRVHMESRLKKDISPLDRAVEVFEKLEMHNTELRNGILIYVALDDKKFAIFGDKGINEKVGDDFWEKEKDEMGNYFGRGEIIEGIMYFIGRIGEKLKEFFPCQDDDVNELDNEISVGE